MSNTYEFTKVITKGKRFHYPKNQFKVGDLVKVTVEKLEIKE